MDDWEELPLGHFTSTEAIEFEIRRVEKEVRETAQLYQNLFYIHGLSQNVLKHLQHARRRQEGPLVNTTFSTSNVTNNSRYPSSSPHSQPSNRSHGPSSGRMCACTPGRCQHVSMSPSSSRINRCPHSGRVMSSYSGATPSLSGTNGQSINPTNPSSSSGSTLAQCRLLLNLNSTGTSDQTPTFNNTSSSSGFTVANFRIGADQNSTGTNAQTLSTNASSSYGSGSTLEEYRMILDQNSTGTNDPTLNTNSSLLSGSTIEEYRMYIDPNSTYHTRYGSEATPSHQASSNSNPGSYQSSGNQQNSCHNQYGAGPQNRTYTMSQ